MQRKPMVWIVDRDAAQRALLQDQLAQAEFDTRAFSGARDIERRLARERPDLLLLERTLDDIDGLELCRRIRRSGDDIPIVVLTTQNEPDDRIAGFDDGVDDYLGKSCTIGELCARIRALLRRRRRPSFGVSLPDTGDFTFGDCRLELNTRTLIRDGKNIELTSGEFAVLCVLANNAHRSLTRERLVELARGSESSASERSIDVQISRLRRLIECDPGKPRHIQTVWGYGYVFVPSEGSAATLE